MNVRRWAMSIIVGAAIFTAACGKSDSAKEAGTPASPEAAGAPKAEAPKADPSAAVTPKADAPTPVAPAPVKPPPPPPRIATFKEGTALAVRTMSTISTKTAKQGERFMATLAEPLQDGSWVVAPAGSRVEGQVTSSDPGGRVKGVASLSVALTAINLADGRQVNISTRPVARDAPSTKKKDAAKVGIASGVGAAIGAIAGGGKGAAIGAGVGAGAGAGTVMATRGAAAEIPSETVIRFTLSQPLSIQEQR
jgi:hypothetical protein